MIPPVGIRLPGLMAAISKSTHFQETFCKYSNFAASIISNSSSVRPIASSCTFRRM